MNSDGSTCHQRSTTELNEALVNADISNSYEEFLAIFDRYYAEDVEVASDTTPVPLTGKAHVLPILFNFLAPLHVMAEIGGLSVTPRYSPIRADGSEGQYAEWSLDLLGVLGRQVTVQLVLGQAVEGLARDLRAALRSSPDRRTSYFY